MFFRFPWWNKILSLFLFYQSWFQQHFLISTCYIATVDVTVPKYLNLSCKEYMLRNCMFISDTDVSWIHNVPLLHRKLMWVTWPLFHKTSKTSLHRLTGLHKDVFMFYETEPWSVVLSPGGECVSTVFTSWPLHGECCHMPQLPEPIITLLQIDKPHTLSENWTYPNLLIS